MSNDDLPRSHAEQTDPSKLGESVGQQGRSGDDYPPDEPLGVEDPDIRSDGSIARDDVETREEREQPEMGEERDDRVERRRDIADTSLDPDVLDDEAEMLGEEGDTTTDAPEVTAIHDVPDDRR